MSLPCGPKYRTNFAAKVDTSRSLVDLRRYGCHTASRFRTELLIVTVTTLWSLAIFLFSPLNINPTLKWDDMNKLLDIFNKNDYFMYILKITHKKGSLFIQLMLIDRTSCIVCPTKLQIVAASFCSLKSKCHIVNFEFTGWV